MARRPLTADQRADADERQQSRILRGLAACIADKGYAATTIADVSAASRVSKSTVYAHFADKEDIFLALYSAATDGVLAVIEEADAEARAAGLAWRARVHANVRAYLEAMAAGRDLTRSLLIEVQAVSPRALALRREVLDRYVRLLGRLARDLARREPDLRVPSRALLLAGIGGMNELMLEAVEAGGTPSLPRLADAATDLMAALLTGRTPRTP